MNKLIPNIWRATSDHRLSPFSWLMCADPPNAKEKAANYDKIIIGTIGLLKVPSPKKCILFVYHTLKSYSRWVEGYGVADRLFKRCEGDWLRSALLIPTQT